VGDFRVSVELQTLQLCNRIFSTHGVSDFSKNSSNAQTTSVV
jgi:hypothetical protein